MTIYSGTTSSSTINFADGTTGSAIYAGGLTYSHNTNRMAFYTTDGTGRMYIDSNGVLLVGMTGLSDSVTFGSVYIQGNRSVGSTNDYAQMFIQHSSSDNHGLVIKELASSGPQIIFKNNAGSTVGAVNTNSSSTTYGTSSDYRLKQNIAPMTGALSKVALLKPCTYTWKADGSDGQGFIAHELAEVVPDAVTGEKDAVETYTDEDGNEQTRIKPQGIDTSFLVATLTAAIQEQQTIITDLKSRIEALEAK
jgi:hypothetical protein